MAFYHQVLDLKKELEALGHTVLAPELEFEVVEGDTSVGGYFERSGGMDAFPPEHEAWKKKARAIDVHFRKIDASDCILVANYEKKGIANYIGANTFLEMGYAFGTGKKIFILNDLPETSPYKEELFGLQPIVLRGDIDQLS